MGGVYYICVKQVVLSIKPLYFFRYSLKTEEHIFGHEFHHNFYKNVFHSLFEALLFRYGRKALVVY